MTAVAQCSKPTAPKNGFTLIEVMVALAVMSIAVLSLLGLRTESIITATEARNLRVASSLAQDLLSELRAGLHNVYDLRGQLSQFEDYPKFDYRIFIGEAEIEEELNNHATAAADSSGSTGDLRQLDRLTWLKERTASRRARDSGGSLVDNEYADELEVDDSPDEESFEDIAVIVYYHAPRARDREGMYVLRSRASTLALSGLTTEQADERNAGQNQGQSGQ